MDALPPLLLGCTLLAYWGCVMAMAIKVRRRAHGIRRVLIPARRGEQLMWMIWLPLVAVWIAVGFVAAWRPEGALVAAALPANWVNSLPYVTLRLAAVAVALGCLTLSIVCWRRMGRQWRMGIDPQQETKLIDRGPFGVVRHPIYALSILLMLCTAVIVPSLPVWIMTAMHIALMNLKARAEERFLLERLGAVYAEYSARTGRFWPRWRRRGGGAKMAG
jgi:protein-S-isoprenylcysteine O-methyltransferase Ste14